MTNYPTLLYLLEPGKFLSKTIHFVPAGMKGPDNGITIFCRISPYLGDGELNPEVRSLIREISRVEQIKTGMLVCAVYGPDDCDYFGLDGTPMPSTEPPKLGPNLFADDHENETEGGGSELGVPGYDPVLGWIQSLLRNEPVH
jgi:hypothetical protein